MARFVNDKVVRLEDLVSIKPGVVASLALTPDSKLFAVAEGESVSEEKYEGDMIYHVLSGTMALVEGPLSYTLGSGDAVRVSAGIEHRIEAVTSFKMIQTFVNKER